MIEFSQAATALLPPLAAAMAPQRDEGCTKLHVVADGEAGGDVVVARSDVPGIAVCAATGRHLLRFGPGEIVFSAALLVALARGPEMPAGTAPVTIALLDRAARVAARDVTVLITGPTGSGKEGLARFVHARSARREGPFVAVNCAAIPETMLEATLFGFERGAFTGATGSAPGLFRAAAGGTLLLDEIGELSWSLQAKLLRVLQEREVLPIGAAAPVAVDARVIATANRDLAAEVADGRFRSDLFYRLAVVPLTTTALAARPNDIVPIAAALWLRQGVAAWPTPAAIAKLAAHSWPGNVRELGNVIARAAVFAAGHLITAEDIVFDTLPARDRTPPAQSSALGTTVRQHETATIRATLAACDGRRRAAAERLGISERTLRYKLAAMDRSSPPTTIQ